MNASPNAMRTVAEGLKANMRTELQMRHADLQQRLLELKESLAKLARVNEKAAEDLRGELKRLHNV